VVERRRPVVRASIDGFHRPRADRYRRGADSPEGYYLDSFDHEALRSALLAPLGPGGDRRVRTRVFDYRRDERVVEEPRPVPAGAVVLFDGVFLMRPELDEAWDVRVFLAASFDVTLSRALVRDGAAMGGVEQVERRYRRRYIPGQRLYLDAVRPDRRADIVIENDDPDCPRLITPSGA
jgi:uridine kinase